MKRLLIFCFLLSAFRLWGAPGDFVVATIREDGWSMNISFEGMATNGTWNFGWGTNNTPTSDTKVKLTVWSPGFDATGASNYTARTVWGTKQVRFPYSAGGAQNFADQTVTSGNLISRVALSDYVYAGDGSITIDVLSGLYNTNSVTSGSVSAAGVVNASAHPYPKVVANWSWRGFRVIDEPTMDLRAVAFHAGAKEGKPVARVEFRVMDSGTNWFTNAVTQMVIDRTMPDANPVPEYVGSFNTNLFTSGLVTCNVRIWPWIGTSTEILDTTAHTGFSQVYLVPLTNAVNYPRSRAIVDIASGNDSTGIVATETYWATNQSPPAFATIGGALTRIYATNAIHYTRTNKGGGLILLSAGNYTWLGATVSLANGPQVECVVEPASGVTRSQVVITNVDDARATDAKDIWRWKNVTIDVGSAGSVFFNHYQGWWENCHWVSATATRAWGFGGMHGVFTSCLITNLAQGFRALSTEDSKATLVRGNTIQGSVGDAVCHTVLGNFRDTNQAGGFTLRDGVSGMTGPRHSDIIVAYNTLLILQGQQGLISNVYEPTNAGWVIANNIFQHTGVAGASDNYTFLSVDTFSVTNVLFWNNNVVGARILFGYNSTGSAPAWRLGWHVQNNVWEYRAMKSDTFGTANAARIGNWPLLNGVGFHGEVNLNTTNFSAAFDAEFDGINSWGGNNSATNLFGWVQPGHFLGLGTATAGGDYGLVSHSPFVRFPQTAHVLPFDLEGNHRGLLDPPGAYASASPRKSAGFFAQ